MRIFWVKKKSVKMSFLYSFIFSISHYYTICDYNEIDWFFPIVCHYLNRTLENDSMIYSVFDLSWILDAGICWFLLWNAENFEQTTTAVISKPVQVANIGLLSAATAGWLMASNVTQVMRFMGTRNQLVTVALHSSGISSLLRHPIDGK